MNKDRSGLRPSRLTVSLITLGLFGLLNIALYVGQEFGQDTEKKELEDLKTKLTQLKHEADILELNISTTEERLKSVKTLVSQCKAGIAEFESQAVDDSLPPEIYSQYTLAIENCNTQVRNSNTLTSNYNSLYDQYNQVIQAHNALVPRANELTKSLGSRYYLIPVPSLRRVH